MPHRPARRRPHRICVRLAAASLLGLALAPVAGFAQQVAAPEPAAVVVHYADMAQALYGDSLEAARALDRAIGAFLAAPSAAGLEAARHAWRQARVPYMQTEAYRFGNPAVDAWEGRVNAWPLDEGLIDYVDASLYGTESDANAFYAANIIASPVLSVAGQSLDTTTLTPAVLRQLHEVDGVEANVATGYHAIEFLLWGQDLNGTGPGAGDRPWTDYASGDACTHGHCARRGAYLAAASALLVADLEEMAAAWAPGGEARTAVTDGPPELGLTAMVTGLGSLAYGELAGERMKLGLMLNDPEEEHDCFADNTHNSHYLNALGMENVYLGRYQRADGTMLEGPSLSGVVAARDAALDQEMRARLQATMAAMGALKAAAEAGMAYDQMLAPDNARGNALIQAAVDALVAQARTTERIVAALDLGQVAFEGSDSLDAPERVFQ